MRKPIIVYDWETVYVVYQSDIEAYSVRDKFPAEWENVNWGLDNPKEHNAYKGKYGWPIPVGILNGK